MSDTKAAALCTQNQHWPAKIITDKGTFTAKDEDSCMLFARVFAKKGISLKEVVSDEPAGEETAEAQAESTESGEAASEAAQAPDGATAEDETQKVPEGEAETDEGVEEDFEPSPLAMEKCKGAKSEEACVGMATKCANESEWPMKLSTTGGVFTAKDEDKCFLFSKVLAGKGYELGTPGAIPPKPKDESTGSAETEGAKAEDSHDTTDGDEFEGREPDFVKSFSDLHLALNANGETIEEEMVLHFEGGKGIPIKLEYSIEKLSSGRYSMDYTIYKDDSSIGGEQSITFEVSGKGLELGFAIKLRKKDNFKKIKWIEIVEI